MSGKFKLTLLSMEETNISGDFYLSSCASANADVGIATYVSKISKDMKLKINLQQQRLFPDYEHCESSLNPSLYLKEFY